MVLSTSTTKTSQTVCSPLTHQETLLFTTEMSQLLRIHTIPLNEKDGAHRDSFHAAAAAAQPKLQQPYHPADQKLFVFS